MKRTIAMRRVIFAFTVTCALVMTVSARGQGINVTGVGPVNRSMGGAGTAAPLDAMGALNWNPGSISGLPSSEVSFGVELLLANVNLASTIGGASGSTNGEAGVAVIPTVGWVHHVDDSPVTVGLGLYGIGGFRNNLPTDPRNPLLATGPIFADAEVMQIVPTIAYALTDRLSIGVAPTVTLTSLILNPLGPSPITPIPTTASGSREYWGAGFQAGIYYTADNNWNFGFSVKSPQWSETFRYFTPAGVTKFNLNYPMIISLGTAYTGFENWVIDVDVRYFDYADTPGFRNFGWSSVFAGAIGAQYRVNDNLRVRFGYNFNKNPIGSAAAALNISDPLIQNQNIATGFSYRLAHNVDINMAYIYLVPNSVSGPLPFGPGDTVTNKISANSLACGITVRY